MVTNAEPENWIENTYSIKIHDIKKTPVGYILDSKYLLKPSDLSSERLLFVYTALNHLQKQEFFNAEMFINTTEGKPFSQVDGKNYILTKYQPFPTFLLEDKEDLRIATELLAKLHLAGKNFTVASATAELEKQNLPFTVKCALGETLPTFRKRYNELKKFKRLTLGSVDAFDLIYRKIADEFCRFAEEAIVKLETTGYEKLCHTAESEGCLCHRDFTGHNIIKSAPPIITNFDNAAIELPVCDLATLLKRCLRKCDWSLENADFVLNTYSKKRNLSKEDVEILKGLLLFPGKLWRISNKYYNSKKSHYEKTALSKIEEIIKEKEQFLNLIKSL